METNGKKIIKVYRYIQQLYKEVAQVMKKLDDLMEKNGWESARGNYTTRSVSKDLYKPKEWLPLGSFRLYKSPNNPTIRKGITICYEDPKLEEPIIIIGKLKYKKIDEAEDWDMWNDWLESERADRKLDGTLYSDFLDTDGEEIEGDELFAFKLTDIQTERDIKEKIFDKLVEL